MQISLLIIEYNINKRIYYIRVLCITTQM